jgi:two-component system cell cycle sensor histidine kinase/response regulator CckA
VRTIAFQVIILYGYSNGMPTEGNNMTQPLPATADEVSTSERRQTILVVDDEQDLRSLVANVLGEYGYKVITAANASKAISMLDKMDAPPDLLLTDVVMPGMSGPMLADQLLAKFAGARVLFMSGYDERQIVQRYVVEKGFALIIKPFQLHNLCAAVKRALESTPTSVEGPAVSEQIH